MKREELIATEWYNLTSEFEKHAKDSKKLALIWKDEVGNEEKITYEKLIERANQIAHVLVDSGLKKGDKALIIMPRLIETYAAYIACLKAGIVVIPSSEMLRAKDISYRLHHGEVSCVISYDEYANEFDNVEDIPKTCRHQFIVGGKKEGWKVLSELADDASTSFVAAKTHRDDMAFLSYTSGTTGLPKGVVHTHGWGYAHLKTAAKNWLAIEDGDTVWATAGPGWQKWIWSPFVSVLGSGATGFVYRGRFEPEKYLQLLEEYSVTVLCCTPTEYRLIAKVNELERFSLPSLRSAVSAGEPLNREVIDTFERVFQVKVRDGYGQTENTLLVGTMLDMDIKPGSMGKPTPGNIVDIINENGEPVDVGEVGDIAVHKDTPALFKQYYKDPERTMAAFRGDYYLTGDKASKDEDGYFWFEGRGDDIIISSGYTIGPFEVEDALVKHPAVQECAVVASPDEVRGNIVKAFVVLKNGYQESKELTKELQEHVKELTAPYKYPREIEYLQSLPKTTSGKIRRVELRKRELGV
ncbi:MAG TPA: acyl--CoA ligase [Massilibacterium sp.]|nr:acyl--CoA ligase [Massilibacterium sp.]